MTSVQKNFFAHRFLKIRIHFCKRRTTWDPMLQTTSCNATVNIVCQHPDWPDETTEIARVPQEKALYPNEKSGSCEKRAVWRPEQKLLSLMKDLAGKLTKSGDSVVELCAFSCLMARRCTLLDLTKKSVGCDFHSEVSKTANFRPSLSTSFATFEL